MAKRIQTRVLGRVLDISLVLGRFAGRGVIGGLPVMTRRIDATDEEARIVKTGVKQYEIE